MSVTGSKSRGSGSHLSSPPPPPDPVLVLSGKTSVTSLVFLSDDVILTGHQSGLIQEWSLPTRRAVSSWSGHSDAVLWLTTIAVPATDDDVNDTDIVLLSQGRDGLVKAWAKHSQDSEEWTLIDQIQSAPLIFCNSAVINSSSGKVISTPSEETSRIDIYDICNKIPLPEASKQKTTHLSFSKSPVRVLQPPDVKGYGMCMRMCCIDPNHSQDSNCDSYLLVGYESGAISLWNALQGKLLHSLRIHDDSVMGLSCWLNTTSGQITGLSASVNNTVQCWKISDNETIDIINNVSAINEGFNDIAIRKDGRIFVTGGWDSRGRVFALKKLRPLAVLTYHKESINCVAFGPNNELVLASKDGYVTFWDVFKNS